MAPIEFNGLTKIYGSSKLRPRSKNQTIAVSDLTTDIAAGRVTGFLGPNGAGKSTALRCLLGLVNPTSGESKVLGKRYAELSQPTRSVGALLDSRGFHPGLSAEQNLKIIATATNISHSRISEVIELVGLEHALHKKTKGYSLGMKQRLSLAIALLGDPEVFVLDEPANGLDPQGIAWLRGLLRDLASQGRTVLVSSHQLLEMQSTVDDVVIINRGKLIAQGDINSVCNGRTLEETFLELTTGSAS